MANPKYGIGSLLKMGDGASPEVFTTVAMVGSIKGPGLSLGTYETTSHDTTGGAKTFITGLADYGEVSFPCYFDASDTTHKDAATGLVGVAKAKTVKNWQIVLAGYSPSIKWSFSGPITKLDFGYPVDGVQTVDTTIRVSGSPTLA